MYTQSKIYDKLQDDLSKSIFENRLLYSYTGKIEYLDNIAHLSLPVEEWRKAIYDQLKNEEVVIYGAGYAGKEVLRVSKLSKVVAFCDSAEYKQGTVYEGHKVISPTELMEHHLDKVVVVTVYEIYKQNEIIDMLLNLGFSESKIVNAYGVYNMNDRFQVCYFPDDIILPHIRNGEVFIDAGSLDFSTSLHFIERCGNKYSSIIAFEPNPNQYNICVENAKSISDVNIYPYALWSENCSLRLFNEGNPSGANVIAIDGDIEIEAKRLDDILQGEAATFIKMDVEGAELNALKGAEKTIREFRPKLALSVYHKHDDILTIPEYILSLYDDYKLYLRHYTLGPTETVLYAI